jgi:hypothetical protein
MIDRKGLNPTIVLVFAAAALATFLVTRSFAAGQASCAVAYLIAQLSCLHVAALYPARSPIRLGWQALAVNCFLSFVRHTVLIPEHSAGLHYRIHLLSQALQLPALISVLCGLAAMWWGIYRLKLGFRVRWWEFVSIVTGALALSWLFRHNLSHAHSVHGILTVLQAISLTLLIAIAGAGLLLHNLAMQMGGGRLAVVMRCIAAYALTRWLLNLTQGEAENAPLAWWLSFYAVPWIFAFGAAYSCWLADGVRQTIRQQPWLETLL